MLALLPACLHKPTYYEHQEVGIRWMLEREAKGYQIPDTKIAVRGGILGDKMGVGKTIQSLGLIINGVAQKTLIITPLAVKHQWESDLKQCDVNLFMPTLWAGRWVAQGNHVPGRKTVYLAHYDKIANKTELTVDQDFERVILDEAQTIRNSGTRKTMSVFKIKSLYRWALTATPIMNTYNDAATYLKFIGFPMDSGKTWQPKYEEWARAVYLSRMQSECKAPPGLIMPPKPIEETRMLDFTSKEEEEVYNGIYNDEESKWRDARKLKGNSYQLALFSRFLRLRQVSVNPQIYINARKKETFGWTGPEFLQVSRKFDEIAFLLREAAEAKESRRWIIFCQFHDEMNLLDSFLKAHPFVGQVLQYHGGLSAKEREAVIDESMSKSGKQDVFLIQLKAGSTGLNLQHYDRIIFISPWWTPAEMEQAKGRAVRIGQREVVRIYLLHLKAENIFNIDACMMEKVADKTELANEFESWSVHRNPIAKKKTFILKKQI